MQREQYNALREELLMEFEGRISSIENQYDLLRLNYLEIIKEVHHDLGGAITTLEGLYNLECLDGTQFKHKEMLIWLLQRRIYTGRRSRLNMWIQFS